MGDALEKDYDILTRLGEGAFGKVYKARHRTSGDTVAVKKIKLGSKSWDEALKSSELAALRTLRHPCIVRLRELIRSPVDGSLYYIFDFCSSDLFRLLRGYPQGMEEARVIELQRQVFAGLAHMHQHNFFHRDIKPENILYDEERDSVCIADFGEARSLRSRPPFTDYVGTRWYRAPECLLRDTTYSSPVDIWAAGLVLCELYRGTPVFMGTSSLDQLYRIWQVFNGQQITDWPEFTRLSEMCRFRVPKEQGCGLHRVLPSRVSPPAQSLIAEILRLNPRRRPLARKCLEHVVFARCPPLSFEGLAKRQESKCGTPSLEETMLPETNRSQAPSARSARPQLSEPSAEAEDAASEPPSPSSGAARPAPSPVPEAPEQPQASEPPELDIDFDAELDKILSVDSPKAPANKKDTMASNVGSALSWTAELNNASALLKRSGTLGLAAPAPAPLSAACLAPKPTLQRMPSPPKSPGLGCVDDLFESLCADLGVDQARPAGRAAPASSGAAAAQGAAAARGAAADSRRHRGADEETEVLSDFDSGPEEAEVMLPAKSAPERPPQAESPMKGFGEGALWASTSSRRVPAWDPPEEAAPEPGGGSLTPKSVRARGLESLDAASLRPVRQAEQRAARPSSAVSHGTGRLSGTGSMWSTGASLPMPRTMDDPAGDLARPLCGLGAERPDHLAAEWSADESYKLKRTVKRLMKSGAMERDAMWLEVARELGGNRGARECKKQYTREYKAHKAATAADSGGAERHRSSRGSLRLHSTGRALDEPS